MKGQMERLNKSQSKQKIEELYFDKLEEDCVDFVEYNDIGNGQSESFVKDEYIVSVEDMIDYIWGLNNWIGRWTLDLYNSAEEELLDTNTEYGIIKPEEKKGSEII
jgi:hypothetical protein